ncbi:FecR family protein [Sinomicrobium sp. M5D2P17]
MTEKQFQHLLEKYLNDTASASERKQVERFFEILQTERSADFQWLEKDKQRVKDLIKNQFKQKIDRRRSKPFHRKRIFRLAAVLLLLVGLAFLWQYTLQDLNIKQESEASRLVVTQVHQIKTIVLEDGTRIILNSGSTLKYPSGFENESVRKVTLEGEAFFDVARDTSKPFVVSTNAIQTRVLGTRFNIGSQPDKVTVALVEGSVRIDSKDGKQLLKPDQKAVYDVKSRRIEIQSFDAAGELAWITGDFNFEQTPLTKVAALVEARFDVKIRFATTDIGEKKITADFEGESMKNIVLAITIGGGLKYKNISKNEILIYK